MGMNRLSVVVLMGLMLVPLSAAANGLTWGEIMLDMRAQAAKRDDSLIIGPWHYRGPEAAPAWNNEANWNALDPADIAPGDGAEWTSRPDWEEGRVHELPSNEWHVHYLHRTIVAPDDIALTISIGSDDGCMVWINGEPVLDRNVMRVAGPDQDQATLDLQYGENELLFAVFNAGGHSGFYFALGDRAQIPQWANRLGTLFPYHAAWMARDAENDLGCWFDPAYRIRPFVESALDDLDAFGVDHDAIQTAYAALVDGEDPDRESQWLALYEVAAALRELAPLRLALADMTETFGDRYPEGPAYRARLETYWTRLQACAADLSPAHTEAAAIVAEADSFRREALLANPLLDDVEQLLVVKRRFGDAARQVMGGSAGNPPLNAYPNNELRNTGWDNELVVLTDLSGAVQLTPLYRPDADVIVRDPDVDFDGNRILFSSVGSHGRWHVLEIHADGSGLRQVTPEGYPDVDFFDPCYLPDGRIIFSSTASYDALDCENGGRPVSNFYLLDRATDAIRQLTFDQVQPQHPTVLHDGRVLYQRWEYADIPHYYSRILFTMNPDGTLQREFYGSGSMFPTAMKHARPIPDHPTQVVTVLGGHHGISESGRLAIIDPALARQYPFRHHPTSKEWGEQGDYINIAPPELEVFSAEETGFVQEIPGYGRDVVGNVLDELVNHVWPHFAHPYPLNDTYFLVSMKPEPSALWGIYLVDRFENMTLIKELEGAALFEPMPLQARPRPPIIPDRVNLDQDTATVLIQDIYAGPGLEGVPRGLVDGLRVFAYHFSYNHTGGHDAVSLGAEGPWDIRRLLGTVPIEQDGSAYFEIPADTPISIQPIDERGQALQLMRSWTVGMPGEVVACVGCHEQQSDTAQFDTIMAASRPPSAIDEWRGPPRLYGFEFEVQPVLDRHCVGCHNSGTDTLALDQAETSFRNLHPYVRRPGPESDLRMRNPLEYHASTSLLVQMLEKGHQGVELDDEAWDRIFTWIDLNAPFKGRWNPPEWQGVDQAERRAELAAKFSTRTTCPEDEYEAMAAVIASQPPIEFLAPPEMPDPEPTNLDVDGFPFTPAEARAMQGNPPVRTLALGDDATLELVHIPAGRFAMGSDNGYPDERPRAEVAIEQSFWMGATPITNAQYALFDPGHCSGYYDEHGKDTTTPGYIGNHADQPVVRITWDEAMAFCDWLSEKTGLNVTLPTEAQWEWAARAGSDTRFYWGGLDDDFSPYANLSDHQRLYTRTQFSGGSRIHTRLPYDPNHHYPLRDDRFDDGSLVANYVAQYAPNAWGLYDMVGNACEWTRSAYRPYPYRADDGRNATDDSARRVARGGSWHDRPHEAGSAIRFAYQPYQRVFNAGFRILVEEGE